MFIKKKEKQCEIAAKLAQLIASIETLDQILKSAEMIHNLNFELICLGIQGDFEHIFAFGAEGNIWTKHIAEAKRQKDAESA